MTTTLSVGTADGQARRLAVEAMAARFELVYWGPRAAGEEALAEIVRLESRLSASQAASDLAWINAHAGMRAVKVEPRTFTLLQRCIELSEETGGAFDVTAGTIARPRAGCRHLHLDARWSTIRFGRPGMRLDLGAAATGYAIDAAVAILRSRGVQAALLHGGTSSVHGFGEPPEGAWTVVWEPSGREPKRFTLRDGALSVAAADARSAVVTGPCSLECDALSRALLALGREWIPDMEQRFPGYTGDVA
jgi:thiamine biosynthesis lipoprotein ApbE